MSKLPFLLIALCAAVALTGLSLLAVSFLVPAGLGWLESLSPAQMTVFRAGTTLLTVLALLIAGLRGRRNRANGDAA